MKQAALSTLLKKYELKVTPKRVAILNIISSAKKPLTTSEIEKKLERSADKIDQVTVYRNINIFVKVGILKELSIKKGISHYEYNYGHTHHHIICTDCGTVEDFTECVADTISNRVLKTSKKFKTISGHNFELFGLCRVCTK